MRTSLGRDILTATLATAMLTACAGSGVPGAASSAASAPDGFGQKHHGLALESIVHSFGATNDGISPSAKLLNFSGTLYGTTLYGGTHDDGTVFAITTTGSETVLHNFGGSKDGADPAAGLINVHGKLYGTTMNGGTYGEGTVFRITPSGDERVVYSFGLVPGDGSHPVAGLIKLHGTLYGTTTDGGAYSCYRSVGCGTVFSITQSGSERVLYSFRGMPGDGLRPVARLINVKGTLYGTTEFGGSGGSACYDFNTGCGTVYSVATTGEETVLHSFIGGADGGNPEAELLNINGTMYGTTYDAGGAVFSIDASRKFHVLHNFTGNEGTHDGAYPSAPLLNVNGTLYGTTTSGGQYECDTGFGTCGSVFSITPSGSETVVYSFAGRGKLGHPDGSNPTAGLININGTLYGTTENGGGNPCKVVRTNVGCGTVFKIVL